MVGLGEVEGAGEGEGVGVGEVLEVTTFLSAGLGVEVELSWGVGDD